MISFKHFSKIFHLSLLFAITLQANPTSDVVELTDKNLADFLSQNENVLLEFYSEGCPHCEEFAPIYNDIAKRVKSSGLSVQVARIDGNKHEESTNEYGIQGFPTVFFVNSKRNIKSEYSGERTADAVLKFLDNKLNRKVIAINDSPHFTQIQRDRKVFIVFCGNNETHPESFSQFDGVLSQHDDLDFFYTNNAEVQNTLGCSSQVKGDLVVVKNFDEGNLKYEYEGNVNATHFQEWISVYTTPVLLELNDQNIQMSMHNHIPSVFYMTNNGTENKAIHDLIYNKATQHRREIIFFSSNTANEISEKILEFYQVKVEELPALLGLYPSEESKIAKFKFTGEITQQSLDQWIRDFLDQKLPKFYQSDALPTQPIDEGIYVIVGNNFADVILNNNKDVLLEMYAPWCGHCQRFAPKYKRLAEKLKNNSNLVIAKMDGTTNEYPGLEIEGFPSFIFFKGGEQTPENKFNNRKLYEGERNVTEVIEFLRNSTFHGISDVLSLPNEAEIEAKEKEEEEKLGEGDEEDSSAGDDSGEDDQDLGTDEKEELEKTEQPKTGVHDEM